MAHALIFQEIVAGIDENEHSDLAVHAAFDLARALGSHVRVIHAVRGASPSVAELDTAHASTHNAELLTAAWKSLKDRVEPIIDSRDLMLDVGTVLTILPGPPAKVLIDYANDHDTGLIVLGPHEKRGLFDFGSTARAILSHHAPAVWVQKGPVRPIQRVLVPVDLSEDSLNALRVAERVAAAYGARVTVLNCFYPPLYAYPTAPGYPSSGPTYVVDDMRESARKRFEAAMGEFDFEGVEADFSFAEGDPADAILERSAEVDLVALGTHGHTGLTASVLGSVAYAVLKRSDTPVLAIRHPDRKWLM